MSWEPLRLAGAFEFTPAVHGDDRGFFFEAFTASHLIAATGINFPVAQVNVSQSQRGTIRGIHYADVPPGQAKFVQCLEGEILDVLIDLRVGSTTFGQWQSVRLTSAQRNAVLIPVGFGHAFQALSDTATVMYCCNEAYKPTGEHGIDPLDAELSIAWDDVEHVLSAKDAAAPSWQATQAAGRLPSLAACVAAEAAHRV